MARTKAPDAPWMQRLAVVVLSAIFGVLWFWLLGFVTKDIGSLPGPGFAAVQARYLDAGLAARQTSLTENLKGIEDTIANKRQQQDILKSSADSLQNTLNQLLSIQRQNQERGVTLPAEQQQALLESQTSFLENQKQYLALNQEIAELASRQHELRKELASVSTEIDRQNASARNEHDRMMGRHRLKIAALKLTVMVPVFLISTWLLTRKRSGLFGPVVYAAFVAVFIRISLIVHEYFPRRYFKYIALAVIIAIVLRLLIYLLKRIASPKKDWIRKRHQEAYDKGICPVCGKPIRVGGAGSAAGRRRKGAAPAGQGTDACKPQAYTCPSCGTALYGPCAQCSDIRHLLLPFCEHCGSEKPDWSL